MARHFLLIALLSALSACGAADIGAKEITPQQLLAATANGESPLILDVRTPEEYGAGHVPTARNIPHEEMAARLAEISDHRDREVVLYCERGGRAARARQALKAAGFERLYHLVGHMSAWRDAGLPIESGL